MNLNLSWKKSIILQGLAIIIFLSFPCADAYAGKVATFGEVIKPDMLQVKNDRLYVLAGTSIFIYSTKDFHLIKKFGREGEGPGEFITRPYGPPMAIGFYSDHLVVNSRNKMSYFTLDGNYVKEEKSPPGSIFYRVEGGYLGIGAAAGADGKAYICFRLFNPNFKEPKMLYETEVFVGEGDMQFLLPMNAVNYYPIYNDQLFIVDGKKGFLIDCFDYTGKKLYSIEKKDHEKIKVTDAYQKSTWNWFNNHYLFKQALDLVKKNLKYKDYFPAIKSLAVDNDRLYAITNKTNKGQWECIIMDLKGKELKRVFVPLQEAEPYTYYPLLYCIEKGKFYALIENEKEETWELYMESIYP